MNYLYDLENSCKEIPLENFRRNVYVYLNATIKIIGLVFLFAFLSGKVQSQNYNTLCNSGMALEKDGNTEAAINKYSDAISIKPKSWEAYSYRAKAYYSMANYDNAITDISQAITLSPSDKTLNEIRGNCYLEKEVYDKALADFNVVLADANRKDAIYFLTFFKRGKSLYYSKRYQDAVDDFTQSILLGKKDPKNTSNISYTSTIYLWRGLSYTELKKYPEAITDFDTHLSVYPNYVQSLFYQGLCYSKSGDTDKAKANARKLLDLDPSKEIYFAGDHLLELYDMEARSKTVKQSLEEAKVSFNEYKSATSKTLGNIKLAEAFAKTNKAWLYSSGITKEDRAVRDTILALLYKEYPLMTEKPELPELARKYMVQANTAADDKKYNEAVTLWNQAISIAPYYPLSYFNRALAKEIVKDYKGATADTKTYIELSPDAPNVRAAQDKIYEWEPKIKTTTSITTTSVPGTVMQNKQASSVNNTKIKVFFSAGLNIPKGEFAKPPSNFVDSSFLKNGNMGAKQGYFVEAGLSMVNETSRVQFYYNPLVVSFASNNMDWSSGSLTTGTNKSIKIIEIAQRYGVGFRLSKKMLIAPYYRPAGVIPLDFKATAAPAYQVDGTMSSKMVFMMSHTFGITISYSFISLSFESYYAHPTYDVRIIDGGNTTHVDAVKIPFRTNRIGIAFTL